MHVVRLHMSLFLLFIITLALNAQTEPTASIRVTGRGTVLVPNDYLEISFAVIREHTSAHEAQRACLAAVRRIITILQVKYNIADKHIRTEHFFLHQYTDNEATADMPQRTTYYRASNDMSVRVYNRKLYGSVMSGITEAGASEIRNIQAGSDNEEQYIHEALRVAFADAQKQARTLADVSGRTLGKAEQIEVFSQGSPMMSVSRMKQEDFALPPDRSLEARIQVLFRME